MAHAPNRQFVRKINKIIEDMDTSPVDPINHFVKALDTNPTPFTFKKILMSDLRKTLSQMKSTGSMGHDNIAVKNIKHTQRKLEPIFLHLVNNCISTTTFPEILKLSKVVPIEKKGGDRTTSEGWHPVNIMPAMSKVIEKLNQTTTGQ